MNDTREKRMLVGFAVDVSGSMKQSIRNESRKDVNRFGSFKNALRKLSRETREKINDCRKLGFKASIDVFAYTFGLRFFPNCDFPSLIHFRQESAKKSNYRYIDPYRELTNIARRNGIEDIRGFEKWIQDVLNREEASRLVSVLNQYPGIAKHIVRLLPRNIWEVYKKEIGRYIPLYNFVTFYNYREYKEKLTKAKGLAKELANTSSDSDIIEIIIREIGKEQFGQSIKEELEKYGEMLMPLEEVADLLETEEKELGKIEPFIYGNTPMKETLELIKKRFEKELARMPDDTIPVFFIISDGAPTDGDPLPIAEFIKNQGIHIISCLITDEDLICPRGLFNEIQPNWSEEAVLMYNMASSLEINSLFSSSLKEIGWTVPFGSKMFVQVNHSEVLDEFIQIILDPIRNRN